MDEVIGIFPTPLMFCQKLIPGDLVKAMIQQLEESETGPNVRTTLLTHTPMSNPRSSENFMNVLKHVSPKLREYGEVMMGEPLDWGVKEIWINKMETGGAQKQHNHANSFISGIIYLTATTGPTATVFHRNLGVPSFQMVNQNERCKMGPFNAPIFRAPEAQPGDVLLFPSYLMHEVPPNRGDTRYTAAFNALPDRIDSWGYVIKFK